MFFWLSFDVLGIQIPTVINEKEIFIENYKLLTCKAKQSMVYRRPYTTDYITYMNSSGKIAELCLSVSILRLKGFFNTYTYCGYIRGVQPPTLV